ncbi:MAG: hypothetical protein IT379_09665 [Deltaproteobacteria bacterium]|nr:hypothetical protein [Deltaproteobacteria bacterium]
MALARRRRPSVLALVLVLGGCAADVATESPPVDVPAEIPTPSIASLSASEVAVGEELRFLGGRFVAPEDGYVEVTFRGTFEPADGGTAEMVNFTTEVEPTEDGAVTWHRFGPTRIPFTRAGNVLGVFRGRVFATNRGFDGQERRQPEDTWPTVEVRVKPSLVVTAFHPQDETWTASCVTTSARMLNRLPYRLRVEAVGFDPVDFEYTVSAGLLTEGDEPSGTTEPSVFRHVATGRSDLLGAAGERIAFADVPYAIDRFRGSIAVEATDASGTRRALFLPVLVHRPLEVRYDGNVRVAQIYEPVPVSGCIPGGTNGRDVTYSESTSETRSRTFSVGWTTNWTESYTNEHSASYGEGGTEANSVGFSSADGTSWSWEVHGEVYGEGGVSLVANGKAGFKLGGGFGGGGSHTDTRSGERSWSESRTFTEARAESESIAASESESASESWTVSSTTSEALDFRTFLLPNRFGVFYRQTTRLVRVGEVIAYDLCGNGSAVGEMTLDDYTWAPDLAMGTECPAFPESQLPPAQCLVPPCSP